MNLSDRALCSGTLRALGGFRAAWEDKDGNDDHGRGPGGSGNSVAHDAGARAAKTGTAASVKSSSGNGSYRVVPQAGSGRMDIIHVNADNERTVIGRVENSGNAKQMGREAGDRIQAHEVLASTPSSFKEGDKVQIADTHWMKADHGKSGNVHSSYKDASGVPSHYVKIGSSGTYVQAKDLRKA